MSNHIEQRTKRYHKRYRAPTARTIKRWKEQEAKRSAAAAQLPLKFAQAKPQEKTQ